MFCSQCGASNGEVSQSCLKCGAPFAAALKFHYAGFWLRFWAFLIDAALLALLPVLVAVIIAPLFFTGVMALAFIGIWIFIVPVVLGEGWLYFALMESSAYQATIGKQALKLKVTGLNGERITFGRASIRYFAKILSHLILNIGFIMAAFTEKKQALHDIIAACLVIRA
jgi:uncharacterized RDD family membrane protein YckC